MGSLYCIESSFESYQDLIKFYSAHKDVTFSRIDIKLYSWFGANMCAVLGAILDEFSAKLNNICFEHIDANIMAILRKNDFLTYYGKPRTTDVYGTTIRFQKLKLTDGKYFKNYVIKELIEGRNTDLPRMSQAVKEKILEAIYEIFVNAQIHSETKSYIYTCGQVYPKKHKIEFTIVDTGIGFREKVNRAFNVNLTADKAIQWAVKDKHTTKSSVSGGIGLAILKEFIQSNGGKMQIISNDGFYEFSSEGEILNRFSSEFPGTIVNLQFRTDDSNDYLLSTEINLDNIF